MRRKHVHCPLKVSYEGSAERGSGSVLANTAVYFYLIIPKYSLCPSVLLATALSPSQCLLNTHLLKCMSSESVQFEEET